MSAILAPDKVLEFKSSSRRSFLHYLSKLSKIESDLLLDIPNQTDAELLDTRAQAQILGKSAWKIECACDSQAWQRAEDKRKSANKDTETESIKKVLADHSAAAGCTPQTLYNNRRVFNLLQSAQIKPEFNLEILDQKKYFIHALKTEDPMSALKLFVEKKSENPKFRPSHGKKLLEEMNATTDTIINNAVASIRAESGILSIREKETERLEIARKFITRNLLPECPTKQLRELFLGFLDDISNYRGHESDEDIKNALIKAWDAGFHREDLMASYTELPIELVSRLMNLMGTDGDEFILVPRPGEFKTWHKVGQPLPIELRGGAQKSINDIRYDTSLDDDDF